MRQDQIHLPLSLHTNFELDKVIHDGIVEVLIHIIFNDAVIDHFFDNKELEASNASSLTSLAPDI